MKLKDLLFELRFAIWRVKRRLFGRKTRFRTFEEAVEYALFETLWEKRRHKR